MTYEVWQQALNESTDVQLAAALQVFLYRTQGQPAFRLLRENRRHFVLTHDHMDVAGRGTIRFTYLVSGEGLMLTIDFPDKPQARQFLDTKDMARAIVRTDSAMTAEQLILNIQQELGTITLAANKERVTSL